MTEDPNYAALFVNIVNHRKYSNIYWFFNDLIIDIDLVLISMVEKDMKEKQELLSCLPSVDEVLKSKQGLEWLDNYPRRYVLQAIRDTIDSRRQEIIEGLTADLSEEVMAADIGDMIKTPSSYSLRPLINATGVVIHTNLGRSILSERALENIKRVSESYSNLEYAIEEGKRGKRYAY